MTPADETTADLLRSLSEQITQLVRQEVALARSELTTKGKKAGFGAGLLAGAGLLGLFCLATLVGAFVAGLSVALPVWAAALIVAAVLGSAGGVLALAGKRKLDEVPPPVPTDALQSTKEDVEWLKTQVKSARP
jgi:MFS family permease